MITENFKTAKVEALDREPIYKKQSIKSVHLLDYKHIDLNGKQYPINEQFLKEITAEIGLNYKLVNQLNKNLPDSDIHAILNKSFINYFKHHKPIEASIIADRKTKNLFRLSKADIIPYRVIFDAIDKIKSNFNSTFLDVHDTQIKVLLNETQSIKIQNFLKEDFSPNIGLSYSYGRSFDVIKVIERIICTNQITTKLWSNNEKALSGINTAYNIVQTLNNLQDNKINEKYTKNVKRIANIQASLNEFEQTLKLLSKFVDKKDNVILNKLIRKEEINTFIKKEYLFAEEVRDIPKEKTALPIMYWDLINAITDFASHDYVYLHTDERDMLQTKAFNMLNKQPDILKFSLN